MPKPDAPPCPRCGSPMMRSGKAQSGRQRWRCQSRVNGEAVMCYQTTDPDAPPRKQNFTAADIKPKFDLPIKGAKSLVITWAQNATPVQKPVLASLLRFCEVNNAALVVIPGRYKNPTSRWSKSQENAEYWAPELTPYLMNQRRVINDNLLLAADLKIQPTKQSPLSGKEALAGGRSAIIGHPKAQMRAIATPQHAMPMVLRTTGAVTVKNYTDTDTGKGAESHHRYGAIVVEGIGRSRYHMRRISCMADGRFIDLDKLYMPEGVEPAPPYEALICGDAHYRFADPAVVKATFGNGGNTGNAGKGGSMAERLNPKRIIFHDLMDAYAVNPHHQGNPFIALAKERAGFNVLEKEVRETIAWAESMIGDREAFIVPSNHDDMVSRYVMRTDWRQDLPNAEFYLETALHMARSARMEANGAAYLDPFQYWVERLRTAPHLKCLPRGRSMQVKGWELGMHGDNGPNGARGTVKNLSRIGTKVVSGHGHSPAEEEGHLRVGTMTFLKLEYNAGPGSWLNTHGAIDALGKPHLFTVLDGEWCA